MDNPQNYDIVIIGGGLVGASLACALRTLPLKIAIIEAAPWFTNARPPSYDDRVIALSESSRRIFTGMNLWSSIASEATPIKSIHISDQGHFGFTRLDHHLLRAPALGYVISARHLGQSLQAALTDTKVDIFAPAQLSWINDHESSVSIEITVNNEAINLKTCLLVAADGGHSKVRQLLGIDAQETDYEQTAIIANITTAYPHKNVAYERFTPTGPLALLPMREHECSLVWTKTPSEAENLLNLTEAQFSSALQQAYGWRLGRIQRIGQRHAYPLRLIRVLPYTRNHVVVIGNAAHTLHPVAGQGLNLGLRDVASLTEAVVESWRKDRKLGDAETLQNYQTWQQPDQQRVTYLTDQLVHLFSNNHLPLVMSRNIGLLLLDALTPLKKSLVRQMAGLNGYPSRLIRGLPFNGK